MAGQLLFVIDEEPFKAKLAEAQARLDAAEASLKKAKDSKAREVALAQRAVDQAGLELAEVEERREQSLYKRNASTVEDVQRKQAMRKRDAAQVEADDANIEQTRADYDTNILSAQADVEGAKAALLDAQINLGYCRLSSPIDGRIGLAEVKLGNLVGPATTGGGEDYTELAVVRQLDPMGIDIQASSRYLDRVAQLIQQGLAFEIFRPGIEGDQAHRFPGKATVIDNAINPTTSTFLIRGELANAAKTLLPGEYVKANAKVGEVKDAIVVPEQSVVETQAGPTVYAVDDQGKVKVTPVRATFTHEGLRVLESGLEPGQQVIVEGLQLVRNGMTVKTRPAEPESGEAAGARKGGASASKPAKPEPESKPRPKPDHKP
jgi:RND family efflux transporter MFP subunit